MEQRDEEEWENTNAESDELIEDAESEAASSEESEEDEEVGEENGVVDRATFKEYLKACLGANVESDEESDGSEEGEAEPEIRELRMPGTQAPNAPLVRQMDTAQGPSSRPPPVIHRVPPSSLFSRLQSFLPQMAESNKHIIREIEQDPSSVSKYDIEAVDESRQHIEMNLALGLYELGKDKKGEVALRDEEGQTNAIETLQIPQKSGERSSRPTQRHPLIEEVSKPVDD